MDSKVYIQLIFLCVVNVMFICSGIILNTLVIVSFWKSSAYLRSKVCYFMIMLLSCFDFLVVITSHPLIIVHLVFALNEEHHLLTVTRIYRRFSIIALLVMTIERYLAVYFPILHRTSVTRRRLLTLLAVLFILPCNDLNDDFSTTNCLRFPEKCDATTQHHPRNQSCMLI